MNLCGTKALPYLTKDEATFVIKQIKTARSTEPPEFKTLTDKPNIVGVSLFFTAFKLKQRVLN